MREQRTVGASFFVGCLLVLFAAELWAIADRLMDIHNDLRAAIAIETRRAETVQHGSVHEGAGPQDIAQNGSGGVK